MCASFLPRARRSLRSLPSFAPVGSAARNRATQASDHSMSRSNDHVLFKNRAFDHSNARGSNSSKLDSEAAWACRETQNQCLSG